MLRVLLLGDSIRMSYWKRAAALLEGKANVTAPEDNCRFTSYTLFNLRNWLGEGDYDVIQWNHGQWDTARLIDGRPHTSLEHYVANTQRIAQILAPRSKRLIFATTTPVHEDMIAKAPFNARSNEDIRAYNAAARSVLEPMGVEVTDLYSPLAQDIHRYISEDRVHLTPDGVEKCAQLVVAGILATPG